MFSLLNTEGYTEAQLAELNRRLSVLIDREEKEAGRPLDPGDMADGSLLDRLSERAQQEFDDAADEQSHE